MGFSDKQRKALKRNLDHRYVRSRTANGRELSYIEGWYAISQANRIFGFDGWNRETVETRCVLTREIRGAFLAVYTAKVRITVEADGTKIVREGHGSGDARSNSLGEVHDTALKAAETDATKRALATFGRPFGLELYRKGLELYRRDNVTKTADATLPSPSLAPSGQAQRFGLHPDDTTPIPRPSHYYGRQHHSTTKEFFQKTEINTGKKGATTPPLAPDVVEHGKENRIDKSQLAIPEPKRVRDKAHLKFIASQPCLICGRTPCDPHHLRFAQPRAIGLKVSDEFTVPLCRGHHRELHQSSNECAWWQTRKTNPLEIAGLFWQQTHPTPDLTASPNDGETGN